MYLSATKRICATKIKSFVCVIYADFSIIYTVPAQHTVLGLSLSQTEQI